MSVSQSGDIQVGQVGFDGQASPSIPNADTSGFPTDEADAALTGQDITSEQASEGADEFALSDDDVAFLQSEQVKEWLAQNTPQGFLSEQQHEERLRKFQSAKDTEIATLQRQSQEQLEERQAFVEAQSAALVGALYQAWQDAGLEPNSPEWNQRQQQVLEATQTRIDRATAQRTRSTSQRNQQIAEHARQTYELLRAYGVELPQGDPGHMAIRQYLSQVQTGQIPQEQLQNAQANVIRQIISSRSQAQPSPQQQQPQPQQPVTPQQSQPTRPNPGPMRSVRGAGGGAGRTFDEIYDAGEQKLIQQYGDATKVPMSAWDALHVEASMQAAR